VRTGKRVLVTVRRFGVAVATGGRAVTSHFTKSRFDGVNSADREYFAEPSDGLEPSTPSLPFRCARNYWRPEATDSACLGRFGRCRTCAGSPPFAPALLHKCSMLGRPARHQHLARRRRLGLLLGGASRRSAAVRGQRGDRRGGLLCPRVLYVRRSELKEISPDAVDVSSFDEAKRVASVAEEERRIIEAERRRLGLDA
jgi:hypothetical protein